MSTAPSGYQNPKTNWAAGDVPTASDFNRSEGNVTAIETGSRTLDPAQAPSGNVGSLRQLLDWLANRLKAITGATNWYDAPATTLATAKSHIDASAPHSGHETPAGAQSKVDTHAGLTTAHGSTSEAYANTIMQRDAGGRCTVQVPVASNDIARKDTVDAVTTALNTHKGAATIDHPDGSVTLAKIATAAKTSPGGTEAGRLAVLDANGRVGDSKKLAGYTPTEILMSKTVLLTTEADIVHCCVCEGYAFIITSGNVFKKINLNTGAITVLAALPAATYYHHLIKTGANRLTLIVGVGTNPYNCQYANYTISGNSWSGLATVGTNQTSACDEGTAVWAGGDVCYVHWKGNNRRVSSVNVSTGATAWTTIVGANANVGIVWQDGYVYVADSHMKAVRLSDRVTGLCYGVFGVVSPTNYTILVQGDGDGALMVCLDRSLYYTVIIQTASGVRFMRAPMHTSDYLGAYLKAKTCCIESAKLYAVCAWAKGIEGTDVVNKRVIYSIDLAA